MRWAPATAGAHLRASGKPPAAAWDPRDAPRPRSGQALLRRPRPGRPRPGPGCTGGGPARTAWSRLHRWRPGPDGLVPAAPVGGPDGLVPGYDIASHGAIGRNGWRSALDNRPDDL